jgi:hypothetical protein
MRATLKLSTCLTLLFMASIGCSVPLDEAVDSSAGATTAAPGTDLRGRIDMQSSTGSVFPGQKVVVDLWAPSAGTSWQKAATYTTSSDGMYYFSGVSSGRHELLVRVPGDATGKSFTISVGNEPNQDIAPLQVPAGF